MSTITEIKFENDGTVIDKSGLGHRTKSLRKGAFDLLIHVNSKSKIELIPLQIKV